MTEWIPGENCDVILSHYKHEPVPLVCYRIQSDPIGPRVRIHFETYWPEGENIGRETEPTRIRHLWFYILSADEMLAPDGSWFPLTPSEIRRKVNDILNEKTDICLYTQAGIISGLYCDDHAIINTIYQDAQTIEVNMTTKDLHDIPIGPEQENSWLPVGIIDPYSVWGPDEKQAIWK